MKNSEEDAAVPRVPAKDAVAAAAKEMVRDVAREVAREAKGAAVRRTSRRHGSSRREPATSAERQARRDARRLELLAAAVDVIRREGANASMDQMAAEAGVTKPILYRHFGDRKGLITAISEFAVAVMGDALAEAMAADVDPRELVRRTIDTYLQFIEAEPEVYRLLVRQVAHDEDGGALVNDFIHQTSRQVAIVVGEGLRASGADSGAAEVWAYGIVGMVQSAGDWWLERHALPRARVVDYLTALVCDGFPDLDRLGTTSQWLSPEVLARPRRVDVPTPDAEASTPESAPAPVARVLSISPTGATQPSRRTS